jgi:hypothetical protein
MDYVPGTTSHAVAVRLGADGRAIFTNNSGSPIHLVMTASGYVTANPAAGAGLRTVAAQRLLDTRFVGAGTPVPGNGTVDVPLMLPSGSAAVVNLTVVHNTAGGFLRVWPVDGAEPEASLTNYPAANTGARAGLAVVQVGTEGKIRIRNASPGTVHILVDLQGWYAPGDVTVRTGLTTAGRAVARLSAEVMLAARRADT